MNGQCQNGYMFNNQNINNGIHQDLTQPQSNVLLNSSNQLAFNDQNGLNYLPQIQQHQSNVCQTDQFVGSQATHNLINDGDINTDDNGANMLMPWEFDGELSNIANYLQSSIV